MHLRVVDAFTNEAFSGNPAAVAIVEEFPSDDRLQAIAAEMNLSETAFARPTGDGVYELRWFTPTIEVNLCGHATLATAHLVGPPAVFETRSGPLTCTKAGEWIEMDFPAWPAREMALPALPAGFPRPRFTGLAGEDWLIELNSAREVAGLVPDQAGLAALGQRAVIVTALADPRDESDIVSRVFAPTSGIPEDPVTGSAHCALSPYWTSRLGRSALLGYQASQRGGYVGMRLQGDRVVLAGQAVTVSEVKLLV